MKTQKSKYLRFIKNFAIAMAIIIILTLGGLFLRPDLTIPRKTVKQELGSPHSRFVEWRGAEIHYTDEGNGIPVLMVHGFGGSHTHYQKLAALMGDAYRAIQVDLPGFGLSELPKLAPGEDYIQLYGSYFDFLIHSLELDSVYVIGNSMGGMMTWVLAADHPEKVKKIVLLAPAGYDLEEVLSARNMFRYGFMRSFAIKGQPLFMTRSGLRKAFFRDDEVDESYVATVNKLTNVQGNIDNMLEVILANDFPDTVLLRKVQCPALIIWGRNDEVIPVAHAARFQRDIKNSEVVIFENAGHCPMLEDPAKTAEACIRFFTATPSTYN